MATQYVHTNIISNNWQSLAEFYIHVFDCKLLPPERNLSGQWLADGTGVKNASLRGAHLLLPGFDEAGPTLEIFQYHENEEKPLPAANREGFCHIAFHVDDVEETLEKIVKYGGNKLGQVVHKKFTQGTLIFTYAEDPEGNIVEIQNWNKNHHEPL
ncbi:MAG: VOC family protein [Spirochaetes bacterium]|nr:VOC family protein [Spirochaetota bacterium]